MARPNKIGLDYFPFDVDFFNDEKIGAVSGEFGIKGELACIKLLCAIYRQGYFILWNEMLQMKLIKELPGVSADLLNNIVSRLVRWDFFDKDLFEKSGILTSKGIQRRYFEITKRRANREDDFPYLLVSAYNNSVSAYINPTSSVVNVCNNSQSKVNKSKLNPPSIPPPGKMEEEEKLNFYDLELPNDCVKRNYKGLLEKLREFGCNDNEIKQIILLSNYGEIGGNVWKIFKEINSGIKMPGKFILSRL